MSTAKGFIAPLLLIVIVLLTAGAAFYFATSHLPSIQAPTPTSAVCTQDVKSCPDGSWVSRVAPACDFATCPGQDNTGGSATPSSYPACKADADCPSGRYVCEAEQGVGTVSPGDNGGSPVIQIVQGSCKLREGNSCREDADCAAGNPCHAGVCTKPVIQSCSGPSDKSCPADYECIQGCGPPIARRDEPPPPYFCRLQGYQRICPICLASNTMIATPHGDVNVKNLQPGMSVWSEDAHSRKIATTIVAVSHTPVPTNHQVIHLVLADGREVWASSGHPTADGTTVGELKAGDAYDGSYVRSADVVSYGDSATYDLLPDSPTGLYWANAILLGSTLKK